MPLHRRAIKKWRSFDVPVSYRVNETRERLRDAQNVFSNQGRLETRHGLSRFNSTTLGGTPLSLSFFKSNAGTLYRIVKVGTVIYSVNASGAATSLKTGLTAANKHRGLTFNNLHIISCESDGLFAFDGTNFYSLGQAVPSAPTIAVGTGTLTDSTYQVFLTFYSSTTGFETNASAASNSQATTSDGLDVTAIPATATNPTIDKVRVYLKDVTANSSKLFIVELSLGTTTYTIAANATSTQVPPTKHATPLSGGGAFLTNFNGKLVYAGNNTFYNSVYFSEEDLPDAFDDDGSTQTVIDAHGDGKITGLAVGFFSESTADPYLVVCKKRSTVIYSEIDNIQRRTIISDKIGCVSYETMIVRNGDVFFMSDSGWRGIHNGQFIKDKENKIFSLAGGDLDDLFKTDGFVYEINKSNANDFFSVYYSTLDQYITFISEGSSTIINKAYSYEAGTSKGFKPYSFALDFIAGCIGEDSSGDEVVYLVDRNGYLFTHSIKEDRTDKDITNTAVNIAAFAQMAWMDGDDYDATYSFRELMLRAITSVNDLTVRAWINFVVTSPTSLTYSFPSNNSGFQLDVSALDVDSFGDEREVVHARGDINRTGKNLLVGFYQTVANGNMGLISAQVDFNKNGNSN